MRIILTTLTLAGWCGDRGFRRRRQDGPSCLRQSVQALPQTRWHT